MQDNNKPINYAGLAGSYKGMIRGLAYTLTSKEFVDYNKYEDLRNFLDHEIERIEKSVQEGV